ncbi:MAG: hypothetical protein KKC25_11190, partial [Proteobacteria bacterium]|nr:hypothetical protein [Pseudomonadota bacterium]
MGITTNRSSRRLPASGLKLRAWASWLAVVGVVLYPIRDLVSFWGRWFSVRVPSPVLYPIK